jgi:hypothetical protein
MDKVKLYQKTLVWNIVPLAVRIIGFAVSSTIMILAKGSLESSLISVYELALAVSAIIASYMMMHYVPSYRTMMLLDSIVGIAFSIVMLVYISTGGLEEVATAFYLMLIILAPIEIFFGLQKSRMRDRLLSHEHKAFLDDYRTVTQLSTTVFGLIGTVIATVALNTGISVYVLGFSGILMILIGDGLGFMVWLKYARHLETHKDDLWGKTKEEKNSLRSILNRLRSI